jgi:hypothetical protein
MEPETVAEGARTEKLDYAKYLEASIEQDILRIVQTVRLKLSKPASAYKAHIED